METYQPPNDGLFNLLRWRHQQAVEGIISTDDSTMPWERMRGDRGDVLLHAVDQYESIAFETLHFAPFVYPPTYPYEKRDDTATIPLSIFGSDAIQLIATGVPNDVEEQAYDTIAPGSGDIEYLRQNVDYNKRYLDVRLLNKAQGTGWTRIFMSPGRATVLRLVEQVHVPARIGSYTSKLETPDDDSWNYIEERLDYDMLRRLQDAVMDAECYIYR